MQVGAASCGAVGRKPWLPAIVPAKRSGELVVRAASQVRTERRERRPQNVAGEFYVGKASSPLFKVHTSFFAMSSDHKCIDCDVCRWMAPQVFVQIDGQSAVCKQPSSEEERLKALQALLSCPTSSIHTEHAPSDILDVQKTFPLPINDENLPGVYHCGYHSERAYGATSYLIVHPKGNILVDSPRYTERLARNIEKLGGARYMFLTHKDDVADHKKWSRRLKCDRILHASDMELSTADVEMQLYGDGPWCIGPDFDLGSVCLFYKPLKVLFTGDHLGHTAELELSIFEQYNQDSVATQLRSVNKLLDLDFRWILPGHGRRVEFHDVHEKNLALTAFLDGKQHS
ncbi:hypothetical protein EJ110_NYTH07613 [Nymphaea thermarum]|nr:hypothetical protein EJ110_NYTH07613 [Nymphaea thermarum]